MTDLTGLDISYAQSTTPALGGYAFVIVKATQAGFVDPRWAQHSGAVRAAGKPLGAYHFGGAATRAPIAAQAALFLATAKDADFLVLDLEHDTKWPTSMTATEAKAFIAAVHAAGRKVGLYHSLSGFPDLGQDWNWVAYWGSTEPAISHVLWQYAGTGVDHDKFRGDAAALAAFIASQGGQDMIVYEKTAIAGSFSVTAGKTAHALKLDPSQGLIPTGAKATTGSGRFDAQLHRLDGGGTPTYAYHVVSGLWSGFWISSAEVDEHPDAASPGFTQADVDAARAAGYAAAKAKAVTKANEI